MKSEKLLSDSIAAAVVQFSDASAAEPSPVAPTRASAYTPQTAPPATAPMAETNPLLAILQALQQPTDTVELTNQQSPAPPETWFPEAPGTIMASNSCRCLKASCVNCRPSTRWSSMS